MIENGVLYSVIDGFIDHLIAETGVQIYQPPLKKSGDFAVRVMGDSPLSEMLNKQHGERIAKIRIYCKSLEASDGIKRLTAIQDYISGFDPEEYPDICENAYIREVSVVDVDEDNSSGEWIYFMDATIKYSY